MKFLFFFLVLYSLPYSAIGQRKDDSVWYAKNVDWYKHLQYQLELVAGPRFYNIQTIDLPVYINEKKSGYSYGALVKASLRNFFMSSGAFYTDQWFSLVHPIPQGIPYLGPLVARKRMNYLDLPVLTGGRFQMFKDWNIEIFGGYVIGYLIRGNKEVSGIYPKSISYPYQTVNGTPQFNDRVKGWMLGSAISAKLVKRFSIRLSANYRIYNYIDNYQVHASYGHEKLFYNKYWNAMLGLQYQLK